MLRKSAQMVHAPRAICPFADVRRVGLGNFQSVHVPKVIRARGSWVHPHRLVDDPTLTYRCFLGVVPVQRRTERVRDV